MWCKAHCQVTLEFTAQVSHWGYSFKPLPPRGFVFPKRFRVRNSLYFSPKMFVMNSLAGFEGLKLGSRALLYPLNHPQAFQPYKV